MPTRREGDDGRPVVVVGTTLLAEMQSDDELAFVLSHEMAHQIAGHIGKQQQQQVLGALIMGGLAAAAGNAYGGVASDDVDPAGDGRRRLRRRRGPTRRATSSRPTRLATYIAARAGYSPERGADIFGRPALANPGGPAILRQSPGFGAAPGRRSPASLPRSGAQQALGPGPDPANAGRG